MSYTTSYYQGEQHRPEESRQEYATHEVQRVQREGTAPGFARLLTVFREAGRDYDRGARWGSYAKA